MLATYRAVFRTPGTASFCLAGALMRLPIAMYPIGLVLIVSARTGHYGFAGVLTGVYVLANGVGNPVLARLTDRLGQRRLLLPASLVHAAVTVLLAICFTANWPEWTLVAPTVVSGFTFLSVGSLIRARWSYVLAGRPELSTAYSLESTIDEVIFVVGPIIATVIATQLTPVLVLYVAVVAIVLGAGWLTALDASTPPVAAADDGPRRSAVVERGMPLLMLVAASMGAIFASAEVSMVAFCGQHGDRPVSGAVLAAFAGGSATAGFLYGARHWRLPLADRFRLQAVAFGALTFVFLAALNVPMVAVCAYIAGLGIAPTLITAFGLIEQLVPPRSLTEGLAWLSAGLSIGYGAGASLVGRIADADGARAAFGVTIGAGVLMAASAVVLRARLRSTASEAVLVR